MYCPSCPGTMSSYLSLPGYHTCTRYLVPGTVFGLWLVTKICQLVWFVENPIEVSCLCTSQFEQQAWIESNTNEGDRFGATCTGMEKRLRYQVVPNIYSVFIKDNTRYLSTRKVLQVIACTFLLLLPVYDFILLFGHDLKPSPRHP